MIIEEAYCSFEVAKLLKEKGFNYPCRAVYSPKGVVTHYLKEEVRAYDLKGHKKLCPTHQMAMKWLREEYKIAINIRITCKKVISYVFDIWDFEIIHPNEFVGGTIDLREQQFDFKSYEEAVGAALKYSLENLI